MILNKYIKMLQTTDMNVHLFVLLQNIVPLLMSTFVWCRLLQMYADSSVMERGHG